LPPGTPSSTPAPTVAAPLPTIAPTATTPLQAGGQTGGRLEDFKGQRQQTQEGGRTIIREQNRVIVIDPTGQSIIRHDDGDRFRYGARNVEVLRDGANTRTVIVRPDGSQIITVNGPDGGMLRRMRRDRDGREIIIIDNSYRDPLAIGGYYIDLPPPVLRIPADRYIVEADGAPPELIYDTLMAPPVERLDRRYSLDEIRYSPSVRQRMPSIDLDTINFDIGSADISPDQAAKLQVIADGLNRAISRNPREIFLIEGHTDATGNDVDNLSLSDRRAESAANLLTQQFQVPAENLTSQGYGEQYLKVPTSGPERLNRRVTIRRITPLLTGQNSSLPPPPPGTEPPR
jgi:OOP family OmpA-OmpF porin